MDANGDYCPCLFCKNVNKQNVKLSLVQLLNIFQRSVIIQHDADVYIVVFPENLEIILHIFAIQIHVPMCKNTAGR